MPEKSRVSLRSSTTLLAGQEDVSAWQDWREYAGAQVAAKITNGATGPTQPAEFAIEVATEASPSLIIELWRGPSKGGNAAETYYVVPIPPEIMYVRTRFYGGSDQNVTIEAEAHVITAVV